jgi:hypothetical protein
MKCFDNYVSVNFNLSSKGVEMFVQITNERLENKYKTI